MNNKEKAVLSFLIASLLIGSGVSVFKRQKVKQNMQAIELKMMSIDNPDSTTRTVLEPTPKNLGKNNAILNINQATAKDLEILPGIGPILAQRIIEERKRIGKFSCLEDLLKVKGIGPKRLEKIKDRLKISN